MIIIKTRLISSKCKKNVSLVQIMVEGCFEVRVSQLLRLFCFWTRINEGRMNERTDGRINWRIGGYHHWPRGADETPFTQELVNGGVANNMDFFFFFCVHEKRHPKFIFIYWFTHFSGYDFIEFSQH